MSNLTNQNQHRSPNPKLARYLQRIEQLVGNRHRTPSPLSTRTPRPLKTHVLDHYLKYQLTFKILCGVADKKNQHCIRYFFNLLRSRHEHEQTKIQKIYKFVPIQKTECSHTIMDRSLSTKILTNQLKSLHKSTLKQAFNNLKSLILTQSQLVSLNTARSNKSNLTPLSASHLFSPKKCHQIGLVLYRMYLLRVLGGFASVRDWRRDQKRGNLGDSGVKLGNGANGIKQYNFQITVNKYINLDNVKICYLGALVRRILGRNLQYGLDKIGDTARRRQQKEAAQQKENEIKKAVIQGQKEKMYRFGVMVNYKNTRGWISGIKEAARLLGYHFSQQEQKEAESLCQDKASVMVSTSTLSRLQLGIIYESTYKMNTSIVSIMMRRKMEFMRAISNNSTQKHESCQKINQTLSKKINNHLLHSLLSIKTHQKSLKKPQTPQKYTKWQKIGILLNLNKYLTYTLKQPFNLLKDHSINRLYLQENMKTIQYFYSRNQVRNCYERLREFWKENKGMKGSWGSQGIRGSGVGVSVSGERMKELELLPRILNKLVLLRYTQFLMQIQLNHSKLKSNKKRYYSKSNQSNKTNIGWVSDIESFISQRDRFNRNITQNYNKISKILTNINTKQPNRDYSRQNVQTVKTNTNNNKNYSIVNGREEEPGPAFSPRNRNVRSAMFGK